MSSNVAHSSMFSGSLPSQLGDHATLYLLAAAMCLLVAVRHWRRAIQPVHALVQAATAAAMVAFTLGIAVVLLVAAILSLR
jgi:hypothetical protein